MLHTGFLLWSLSAWFGRWCMLEEGNIEELGTNRVLWLFDVLWLLHQAWARGPSGNIDQVVRKYFGFHRHHAEWITLNYVYEGIANKKAPEIPFDTVEEVWARACRMRIWSCDTHIVPSTFEALHFSLGNHDGALINLVLLPPNIVHV